MAEETQWPCSSTFYAIAHVTGLLRVHRNDISRTHIRILVVICQITHNNTLHFHHERHPRDAPWHAELCECQSHSSCANVQKIPARASFFILAKGVKVRLALKRTVMGLSTSGECLNITGFSFIGLTVEGYSMQYYFVKHANSRCNNQVSMLIFCLLPPLIEHSAAR